MELRSSTLYVFIQLLIRIDRKQIFERDWSSWLKLLRALLIRKNKFWLLMTSSFFLGSASYFWCNFAWLHLLVFCFQLLTGGILGFAFWCSSDSMFQFKNNNRFSPELAHTNPTATDFIGLVRLLIMNRSDSVGKNSPSVWFGWGQVGLKTDLTHPMISPISYWMARF